MGEQLGPGDIIFQKAQTAPETLSATERLMLGLGTLDAIINLPSAAGRQRLAILDSAMDLTTGALGEIKSDPQFSEGFRFRASIQAASRLEQVGKQHPHVMPYARMMATSYLTMAAGLETPIKAKIGKNTEAMIRSYTRLAALLHLRGREETMHPLNQVEYLAGKKRRMPEDQQKAVTLEWATHLVEEGLTDDQYISFIKFFDGKGDTDAVLKLTGVKLGQVAQESSKE